MIVPDDAIIVVSGLPRSGTSMMMNVLTAGGLTAMTDQIRAADIDNPKGYYEFERVKKLPQGDTAWLEEASGKCVKVISALLPFLPPSYTYRVIFMHRQLEEVMESQRKMLEHRNQTVKQDDNMASLLQQHVEDVRQWLVTQPNIALLDCDYNSMLATPEFWVDRINSFLGKSLDPIAMLSAVDFTLYRNRVGDNVK
ncbi:MAG: sulfotransferase family protein [Caldilinea sp.]